jgi:hypothetical protein
MGSYFDPERGEYVDEFDERDEHVDEFDEVDYDDDLIDGVGFKDPGGRSALRSATRDNPRNLPCPNCKKPNRLTPIDRQRGYQCDECADRAEGRFGRYDY